MPTRRPTRTAASVDGAQPQTALAVGIADALAHTTRNLQVRIQFAWQRGAGANAGGLTHNTDEKGSAPGDERSGTWVRVAEALAGPNWGSQFTPRIGTEVLVDFIEGDMDCPVVVALLYTGADTPPFSPRVDSATKEGGTKNAAVAKAAYQRFLVVDATHPSRKRSGLTLAQMVARATGKSQ